MVSVFKMKSSCLHHSSKSVCVSKRVAGFSPMVSDKAVEVGLSSFKP